MNMGLWQKHIQTKHTSLLQQCQEPMTHVAIPEHLAEMQQFALSDVKNNWHPVFDKIDAPAATTQADLLQPVVDSNIKSSNNSDTALSIVGDNFSEDPDPEGGFDNSDEEATEHLQHPAAATARTEVHSTTGQL